MNDDRNEESAVALAAYISIGLSIVNIIILMVIALMALKGVV